MVVVAYVPDLMDRSRLAAALPEVVFVNHVDELGGSGAVPPGAVVLVDLSRPGTIDLPSSLPAATRTVGFGAHVERDLLDRARAAGWSRVCSRRELFADVDGVLGG